MDTAQAALDKGLKFADKLLQKDVSKSKITEEVAKATRERLRPTLQMSDLSAVDFVIEAVPEIPALKEKIFAQLAEVCPKHAILATNTSSSATAPDSPHLADQSAIWNTSPKFPR